LGAALVGSHFEEGSEASAYVGGRVVLGAPASAVVDQGEGCGEVVAPGVNAGGVGGEVQIARGSRNDGARILIGTAG
jgi:hypothetical protein